MSEEAKDNIVTFPVPSVANSLDDIRDASNIEYRELAGFKPGQKVWIGSLTAGDMLEWSEAGDEDKEVKRMAGLRLVSKSLVSVEAETGKPGPTSVRYANTPESLEILKKKNQRDMQNLVKEILDLNGLTPRKEDAAKKD